MSTRARPSDAFPKTLPCLICGKKRKAKWAGDRLHPECREARSQAVFLDENNITRPSREDD